MINKILTVLTSIFGWLFNMSNQRRTNRREDEQYHREAMAELRKSNDEMIVRMAELYREVVQLRQELAESNKKMLKYQTENEQLAAQIKVITEQNADMLAEIKRRKRPATKKKSE